MPDNNNFNELLIHTLKQIHVRLDRLEVKVDEKTDKTDLKVLEQRLDGVESRLDGVESRLDRIESGIGTLKWVMGVGLAAMSVFHCCFKNVLMRTFWQKFLKWSNYVHKTTKCSLDLWRGSLPGSRLLRYTCCENTEH